MAQVDISSFNKEILLLRLAITTECLLDCRYCFVRKKSSVIALPAAFSAIDLLIHSPGENKILILYGGEPLLYFEQLKCIIIYAFKKAKKLGKKLIISLGTNGLLLNKEMLMFFSEFDIKLSVSVDGNREYHDRERIHKNKNGSYSKLLVRMPEILETTESRNLCALFAVTPHSVSKMYNNFLHIVSLGFKSINIEPVINENYVWASSKEKKFLAEIVKIMEYIYNKILLSDPVFLNTVSRELTGHRLSSHRKMCPFYQSLEVYPAGEMAFSPFLINSRFRKKYIIGEINVLMDEKFISCRFNENSDNCRQCWNKYRGLIRDVNNAENLMKIRNLVSIRLADFIIKCSKGSLLMKEYMKESRKRIFE